MDFLRPWLRLKKTARASIFALNSSGRRIVVAARGWLMGYTTQKICLLTLA
jgi:hypothetical protein